MTAQRPHCQQMTDLCRRFPSLRDAPGVDPWDQFAFARWASGPISAGERLAAAFVLGVWSGNSPTADGPWNTGEYSVGTFDLHTAWATWDGNHKAAFLFWVVNPFWP